MATRSDPLLLLRASIASSTPPIPTTSSDASTPADSLAHATHLVFNTQSAADGAQHTAVPLSTPTRFISAAAGDKPLDLRSVYFCWLHKDSGVGDYISATQALNQQLQADGAAGGTVNNLVFVEKLDLVTWLSGDASEHESEFIKSEDNTRQVRQEADAVAGIAAGDGDVMMGEAADLEGEHVKGGQKELERLKDIYAMERRMGDHNTVLRGVKPTDFSHIRKHAESFLRRTTIKPTGPTPAIPAAIANRPTVKPIPTSRRPEQPIILLSPSASSLLRLPNIKSFLVDGVYTPPDTATTTANILHINRLLPSIDPNRPLRFILVDTPDHFKPDYWSRVVAVFTTGQTWQFKGYKWTQPAELFSHALGVYVGWRGELIPDTVKGWGRGVLSAQLDKYVGGPGGVEKNSVSRWRDREVVEDIWGAIEGSMRARGWGKEGT
ncbi:accessory factor associated with RNA polymerase II [Elasticomyces elasticus]|nr:accessory factor associated with RNA polymerase II [Elasticomyces elasticus]